MTRYKILTKKIKEIVLIINVEFKMKTIHSLMAYKFCSRLNGKDEKK